MSTTPTNSDSSASQVTSQINGVARDVQALQTTQIFKDDTGTRRVLLGKGADGFYGLKVSESGVDVYDAANDDLVFNSSQNVFKIVESGTLVLPAAGIGAIESVTHNHNLGFVPAFQAYQASAPYFQLPVTSIVMASGVVATHIFGTVSDTDITFTVHNSSASPGATSALSIKYYLLQETVV